MSNEVKCPKCGSTSLSADRKGFSGKKAVAGAILTGGIGLLAGTIGSNKILITCLNCGKQFKPGEQPQPTPTKKMEPRVIGKGEKQLYAYIALIISIISGFICIIMTIAFCMNPSWYIVPFVIICLVINRLLWGVFKRNK